MTVWGLLAKSLIDNETIEQAIARLIAAHEADEAAHLGAGEALQSHKASEIIDHAARSIVLDKFLEYQEWDFPFESVDAYQKSIGTGGAITPYAQALYMRISSALNGIVRMWTGEVYNLTINFAKNPVLQFSARIQDIDFYDAYVLWGEFNPFAASPLPSFGFKVKHTEPDKIYGVYNNDGSSFVETELTGIDPNSAHFYRAEISDSGATLKFYVDGVLKATVYPTFSPSTSDYLFCIAVKSTTAGEGAPLYFWNFSVQQDL